MDINFIRIYFTKDGFYFALVEVLTEMATKDFTVFSIQYTKGLNFKIRFLNRG